MSGTIFQKNTSLFPGVHPECIRSDGIMFVTATVQPIVGQDRDGCRVANRCSQDNGNETVGNVEIAVDNCGALLSDISSSYQSFYYYSFLRLIAVTGPILAA